MTKNNYKQECFALSKLGYFADLKGNLERKRGEGWGGGVFLKGGWYPNAHYVASKIFQVGQNHVPAFHEKKNESNENRASLTSSSYTLNVYHKASFKFHHGGNLIILIF